MILRPLMRPWASCWSELDVSPQRKQSLSPSAVMNESVPPTAAGPVLILTYYDIPGLPEGPLISFAIRIFIVLPLAPTLRLCNAGCNHPQLGPLWLISWTEGGGLTLQRRASEFPAKIPPGASEKIPEAVLHLASPQGLVVRLLRADRAKTDDRTKNSRQPMPLFKTLWLLMVSCIKMDKKDKC